MNIGCKKRKFELLFIDITLSKMQDSTNTQNIFAGQKSNSFSLGSPRSSKSALSIVSKRQQFHASIRKQKIRVQMDEIRNQVLMNNKNQIVTQISQKLQKGTPIYESQITSLIDFANDQLEDAVNVLATVLAKNIIKPEQVAPRLQLGKCSLWGWFLRVMYDLGYCEMSHIEFSMTTIIKHNNPKFVTIYLLQQTLNYLQTLLRSQQQQVVQIIADNSNFVLAILNLTNHQNYKVYSIAISILARIVRYYNLIDLLTCNNKTVIPNRVLANFFYKILLKSEPQLRGLGVQMLTNMAFIEIVFPDTIFHILKSATKQKTIVKVQISFYLLALLRFFSDEDIRSLIDQGIFSILKQFSHEEKQVIVSNAKQCVQIIKQKCRSWTGITGNQARLQIIAEEKESNVKERENTAMQAQQ